MVGILATPLERCIMAAALAVTAAEADTMEGIVAIMAADIVVVA